jgi:hypothetical protein
MVKARGDHGTHHKEVREESENKERGVEDHVHGGELREQEKLPWSPYTQCAQSVDPFCDA